MSMTCVRCPPALCLVPLLFVLFRVASAAPAALNSTTLSSTNTTPVSTPSDIPSSTIAPISSTSSPAETTASSSTAASTWPEYEPVVTTTLEAESSNDEIRLWPGYWIKTEEQVVAQESSVDYRTEVYHIADLFSTTAAESKKLILE